jgi:hypothetical protein
MGEKERKQASDTTLQLPRAVQGHGVLQWIPESASSCHGPQHNKCKNVTLLLKYVCVDACVQSDWLAECGDNQLCQG